MKHFDAQLDLPVPSPEMKFGKSWLLTAIASRRQWLSLLMLHTISAERQAGVALGGWVLFCRWRPVGQLACMELGSLPTDCTYYR
jgi:hypothetical protein